MLSKKKTAILALMITTSLTTGNLAFADSVKDKGTATNVKFNQDFKPAEWSAKDKPNVLIIGMDDLGYGQLNYDEKAFDKKVLAEKVIPERYQVDVDKAIEAAKKSTPNLRKLQDQGVMMSQTYVCHGVSGPSRSSFMTAQFPSRFGVYSNDDSEKGVPLDHKFLAELFQNYGYETTAIGKWHVGEITNVPVPPEKQTRDYHDNFTTYCNEPYQPQNRGFDYFMGFHPAGAAYYNSPSLFRNREHIEAKGYITDQLTDEAIDRIKHAKDAPFFMYLAYNAPHIPLEKHAPEKYRVFNTGNEEVDKYYESIYAVDSNVGRIVDTLKKEGKLDNTIIFFFSDNGSVIDAPLPMNGIFQGNKGETFNGGVHIPGFVTWKNGLKPGQYDKMVSLIDYLPTALGAAQIPIPEDWQKQLDGVNLLPYLQNENTGNPHDYLLWAQPRAFHWDPKNIDFWRDYDLYVTGESDYYPKNPYMERLSDFSWTVRDNNWTLHYYLGDNTYELYDTVNDPKEENNLADQHPEVISSLKKVMHDYLVNKATKPNTENNLPKYEQLLKATE